MINQNKPGHHEPEPGQTRHSSSGVSKPGQQQQDPSDVRRQNGQTQHGSLVSRREAK